MFNHNSETKGHGSIRKNKVYGTIGVIALGAIAMFSNNKTASADEVSSSEPTTTTAVASAADTSLAVQSQAASAEAAAPATATDSTAPTANATAPVEATSPAAESTPTALASSASDTTPVTYTAPAAAPAAPAAPAESTEPKVTVENQKLKDAVSEAKGYNIDIKQKPTENIGTANNQVESDAKKDLANTLEETQATRIKTGVDAYKLDLKKAQENVGTDGYLSEVVSQGLKFESEPNGKLSISGATEFGQKDMPKAQSYEEYVAGGGTFGSNPVAPFTTTLSGGGSNFVIPKIENNQTITATYSNLQNSTYNGKKISKVVYEVTNISGSTGIVGFAEKDPTKGIYTFYKINAPSRYRVNIRFYDSDDNPIQFTKTNPAILAMTSLTKTEPTTGRLAGLKHEESITDYNFRPVKITGSLVEKQADGRLAATSPTHAIKDDYDDPNFYKMGIAGVAESGDTISFVMQRKSQWDRGYWLALTSKLPSRFTLVKPDLEYNLVEYNLAGNVVLDNYIQGTTTKLTNTQTVKPTGTPVGEDYTTTHQDRITTADGKVYKYVSSTNNTTGKVKLGTTNVANYYTEVKGNVVVDYQDKQGNTISPRIVDTPDTSVGTAYDTTDHKPSTITTADGTSYRIDPTATQGQESGRVVEGTTRVIYVYDKVEKPVEKYGNVVVDYQDKQGNTISPRVVDTPTSRVGTYYDTTDHKPTTITADDGTTYRIDTNATQGQESGQVVEGTTRVVYVYDKVEKPVEKKYGDVTVEYKNKDGVTIAPKVTDTPRSEVGTDYDTTDQRKDTITTVDGKKYKLDPTATQGAETGKVVEGNTNIVYYYDLVPDTPAKKYGDVTVEYKNKDGVTIAPKVTDTPRSEVGTDYDTTDQRKDTITTVVDGKKYKLDPTATQGAETGKVVEGNTNIVYYYDLVPDTPAKKYGDVTVEYKNKDGVTIAPKVTDTPRSEVGTDYDTTDQRKDTITTVVDGKKYKLDPTATQGAETGKVVEGNTNIVYYYDLVPDTPAKKYGDVTVEYKNKDGVTIAPKVTDTPRSEVGTDYDTTDQRKDTITTVDGKKYKLDLTATQGAETGKVVEGNTNIVYYYDLVPDTPAKKYGDVTVEYKNKDGVTIAPKVTDTPRSEVGTDYDTTDQRKDTITTVDGKKYKLDLTATQGAETGKVVEGNTNIVYYYDLVPDTPAKKYGDVTVEYKNKDGVTIAPKVTDTPRSEVGTDYDTTDQRKDTITTVVDGKKYKLDPTATQGAETGKVVEGNTNIVYYYDLVPDTPAKKYGDVTVEYKNKDGVTIAPKVTDTPRSEVGTDYDTTDQRKDTITTVVDGKKYKLDPTATQGAETGKVVEGNTNIVYYYDLVPDTPAKKYGDVTVEYKNKDGVTIAPKVTDTPRSEVGTDYDTTDQRKDTITTVDGKKYKLDLTATQGAETGKVVEGNTNIVYYYDLVKTPEEYGNVVVDYQDKKGNTIAPRIVDTPTAKVGTAYDTTDHKPVTIVSSNGKTYRIDPTATQGQESGEVVKGTTRVVYVYDEVLGDVTVHYKDESGKVIKEPEKDTTGAPINTLYDTRDHAHKTITTQDGRVYEIIPEKTIGLEQGRIVEGNTDVTYIYKEVFGDVVVHYVDESGKKIKEDVTDTARGKVGEDYDTTDHKSISIKHGNTVYNIVPEKTKGQERGKVVKGVTEVTYVYKAVQAEPKKTGTNAKGEDVNGKTMLAGSTEVYTINIDNDQYKGTTGLVDQDKQAGLTVIEKYSSKFVTPNLDAVRMTTEDGKVVSGFTTKIYKSVAEASQKVQDYIKAKGLTIDGEFAATTSDDPVAYTNNYALKGINLKLIFPTTVKKDIKEASKYDNKAYQIDFAGIAETNIVTNNIPKINPKKDVVATVEDGLKDQNSLDGKTIKVGAVYNFELNTSYLPAKRGQSIDKIEVKDTYSPLVEYNGVHKWIANTDILLKDNTKIAKGTDLTQYVNQDIDHQARTVVYGFSNDFLSKVSDDSEFQAIGYMQVKQVDNGTVKNTFTEIINNVERDSNTVTLVSPKEYGDVVVHYVDESGKKIKEDVTDTARGKVGEDYDTTDHKSISIKHGNTVYNIVPEKTKGQERGKVVKGVTEVTYVYKAVQAEPKKTGTNAKGEDVNGKTMLAGSTEVYTINIDNDQYKGTTGLVDQDKQAGLMVVEKYSSKFVTPNLDAVRMTTEDGKVVSGFTTKIYKSVAEAPQKVQDYIKAKGLTIDGEFAVTTSDDPVAYTNNYALKGINLKLIFPTTVKKDIKEASKYDNKAYQIDFAGIAETNIVTNNIPKINPKKDVVATVEDGLKDQNSLDGKTVKVGAVYNFELNTSYLPAKRGQSIDKIEVKDTYSPLVEYNGVHKWIANTDILLKDSTKIAKGTDLTQYVNQNIDHKARTVVYSFSNDFLSKVSDDSEFQAIGYMQVKQLDYGTVENTFTEIVNDVERDSNTVTVVTPEKPQTPPEKPQTPPEKPQTPPEKPQTPPEKPQTPPEKPQTPPEKPQTPPATPTTPVVPTTPQTELPETGETDHTGAAVLGLAMVVSAMSIIGSKKRKEEE